ncbi:hypothetical protein [Pseudomonas putida]
MNPCTAKLDLYLTQRKALIDYATAILGCRQQAERLVQEAWLRFGAAQGDVRPSGLFRIVRNLARARVRPPVLPAVAPRCEPQRPSLVQNLVTAASRLRWPSLSDGLRQRLQA